MRDISSQARPDEICQAKQDNHCPRCNRLMHIIWDTEYDDEGVGGDIGYCKNCKFAF